MFNLIEAEKEIIGSIKKNDLSKAVSLYKLYYSSDKFLNNSCPDKLRCRKNNLICLLCCISRSMDFENSEEVSKISEELINSIEDIDSRTLLDSKAIEAIKFFAGYNGQRNIKCNNYLVNKAMKYIEENYSYNLTLEDIANELHISKSHLSYLFIKNTGMKITQFINRIRINEAKKLLEDSNYSLSYISNICGFNNQNYFSTLFKKTEQMTPLEYRKNKRAI